MSIIVFLLIILSAISHAVWNFAAKKVAGNFYVIYLGLFAVAVLFLPFLFFLPVEGLFNTKACLYVFTTGAIHAAYFFLLAKAYEYGEISTAYPIARGTGIAGTALVAYFLLCEHVSMAGFSGIISISAGTILIGFKISLHKEHYKGIFFAFLVGTTIIGYSIVDKLGVGLLNPIVYLYGLTIVSMICLTPYVLQNKAEVLKAWRNYKKYIFIVGLGSFGTYLIILFIFRIAQVSYVVALREIAVAIGAILGFKFLHEKCTIRKIIGIILIVLGMIAIKIA